MKLLDYFTLEELIHHFFNSNMHGEAQLDVAFAAIEGCVSSQAAWDIIVGALQANNFSANPNDVVITDLDHYSIVDLVGHYWNSCLAENLAEAILDRTYELVAQRGESWETWVEVKQMAERLYGEWEDEIIKRKTVSSVA